MKTKFGKIYGVNKVLFVLIGVFSLLFLFKFKQDKGEYVDVEIQVVGPKGSGQYSNPSLSVPYWLIDAIEVGDVDLSVSEKKNAEVKDIISYDEGNKKVAFLKLSLRVDRDKNNRLRYKERLLTVGSLLEIDLSKVSIVGYVSSVDGGGESNNYVYKKVKVRMYDRYAWFSENVNVGDMVVDSHDLLQSEVLSKKNELAKRSVRDVSGNLLVKNDPLLIDILVDLKLRLVEKAGIFYFANYQPVKVGNDLWIPFNNYNLYGVKIVSIDEIN